jgi:hypothetical protein
MTNFKDKIAVIFEDWGLPLELGREIAEFAACPHMLPIENLKKYQWVCFPECGYSELRTTWTRDTDTQYPLGTFKSSYITEFSPHKTKKHGSEIDVRVGVRRYFINNDHIPDLSYGPADDNAYPLSPSLLFP